jgi:CRISPR-associated protein Csb2
VEGLTVSTTLVLTFPFGRYHATPWDRHVNEAAVEVPPSPWRLLRTLYSVWRCRRPELAENVVHPLLADLAVPPTFYVPTHDISHTRHYYPDNEYSRDLVFDAFAAFAKGAQLAVRWPVELSPDKGDALRCIAGSIPYFGRADSICTGAVDDGWQPAGHAIWKPLDVAEQIDGYLEAVSVLTPELPLIVDNLLVRPAEVRRSGLRLPAGSRFVAYGLQRVADEAALAAQPSPPRAVTTVRFDLLHPALPAHTHAVVYADLLRRAAISKQTSRRAGALPKGSMLSGKTAAGEPMTGAGHAHYLPIIRSRRVTGLVLWAPGTLSDEELGALCGIRELYDRRERAIQIRVSGIGVAAQVAPEFTGPARTWLGTTPFMVSRYPKRNRDDWHDFVMSEAQRELRVRGLDKAVGVEFVDGHWTSFVRHRPSARARGHRPQGLERLPAEFLRLRFARPLEGPLALGRLSHFGLGLFLPDTEQ